MTFYILTGGLFLCLFVAEDAAVAHADVLRIWVSQLTWSQIIRIAAPPGQSVPPALQVPLVPPVRQEQQEPREQSAPPVLRVQQALLEQPVPLALLEQQEQ